MMQVLEYRHCVVMLGSDGDQEFANSVGGCGGLLTKVIVIVVVGVIGVGKWSGRRWSFVIAVVVRMLMMMMMRVVLLWVEARMLMKVAGC